MNCNREILLEKLRKKNVFWSYDVIDIPDEATIVENVLLWLDISDIDILFNLYDKDFIRKVWEERLLPQEPYYHGLNRFYAWFYFGINNPDDFLEKRNLYFQSC